MISEPMRIWCLGFLRQVQVQVQVSAAVLCVLYYSLQRRTKAAVGECTAAKAKAKADAYGYYLLEKNEWCGMCFFVVHLYRTALDAFWVLGEMGVWKPAAGQLVRDAKGRRCRSRCRRDVAALCVCFSGRARGGFVGLGVTRGFFQRWCLDLLSGDLLFC